MFSHTETIRVRYGETDQMGYVYYGNYALYYEVGRVELLRNLGIAYSDLEKEGVALPVVSFDVKYIKPAKYDDLLRVVTSIKEVPSSKIIFYYECYNSQNVLINSAQAILVFISILSGKPIRCPLHIEQLIKSKLNE